MAKYIVQQYIAAVGGENAISSIDSMYAMGKVRMAASEFCAGDGSLNNSKVVKVKSVRLGVERWERLYCGRKGQSFGAWSSSSPGARLAQGVMARWLGGRPLGTTLTPPVAHLGLFAVSYR